MNIDLVILLVLGFASYRITRFLAIDTLIEGLRGRFHTFLFNRQGRTQLIWHKLLELTSCTWCLGFWVSLALYSIFSVAYPWDFSRFDWIGVFAVAGVQGLLHAFEPGDE